MHFILFFSFKSLKKICEALSCHNFKKMQLNLFISQHILDVSPKAEYRFGSGNWALTELLRLASCCVALPVGCNWLQGADRRCSPACYQTDGQPGKHSSVTRRKSDNPDWARPIENAHKRTLGSQAQAKTLSTVLELPLAAAKISRGIM